MEKRGHGLKGYLVGRWNNRKNSLLLYTFASVTGFTLSLNGGFRLDKLVHVLDLDATSDIYIQIEPVISILFKISGLFLGLFIIAIVDWIFFFRESRKNAREKKQKNK